MHNIKEAIYENKSKLEGIGEDYQIQVLGTQGGAICQMLLNAGERAAENAAINLLSVCLLGKQHQRLLPQSNHSELGALFLLDCIQRLPSRTGLFNLQTSSLS